MRPFITAGLVLFFSTAALADEADKLSRLAGEWVSDDGPATHVESKCAWSPNRHYLVCDQRGTADGKPYRATGIYGYSEADKKFVFHALHGSGSPFTTELIIEGDVWTYAPPAATAGEERYKTTNQFISASRYSYQVLVSKDGEKWTVVKSGESRRPT